MSILSRLIRATGDAQPKWQGSVPLTSSVLLNALGLAGPMTSVASPEKALTIPAAKRATEVLAGSVASVDKQSVKKADGKVNDRYKLVHEPHPLLDEYSFFELMMTHLIYEGRFYALKARNSSDGAKVGGAGNVSQLHILNPASIVPVPVIKNGLHVETVYVPDGKPDEAIPSEDIFVVNGLGFDGLRGVSLLTYAKRVLESTASSDEFASKFYSNGTLASGILSTEKRLDEKAAEALKQRWRQKVQGIGNAFDTIVLDSGTTYQQISLSPQDAQWIEARQFNVYEIARIFGVHPQLLFEDPKTSSGGGQSAGEQKSIDFVQFTLRFWTSRISQAWTRQLSATSEKLVMRTGTLVQPDMRTRSSAAVMWRTANVKSINELRDEEGLPRDPSPDADDIFFTPSTNASDPGTNQGAEEQPVPGDQEPTQDDPQDQNL